MSSIYYGVFCKA